MSDESYLEEFHDEPEQPHDRKVDEAMAVLMDNFFRLGSLEVYYGRQLEVLLERDFFHWITKKALNELAQTGRIRLHEERTGLFAAHFYTTVSHRYPRRQIREMLALIAEFSDPAFTRALGDQGEILADAGFAHIGFRVRARNVREVGGQRWEETGHNLDRLIERDGIRYGVEIKNQLGYIGQTEFQVKLAMCGHFGVRPMFIARSMPKSYINDVWRAGGFCLILGNQHYPLMMDGLAKRVRDRLALPVLCIRALPDTTLSRFENWHKRGAAL